MTATIKVVGSGGTATFTLSTDQRSHSFYSEHPDAWLSLIQSLRVECKKHLEEAQRESNSNKVD